MSANSKIEWTDHTSVRCVDGLVTGFAQGHTVGELQTQLWVSGERLDVVRMQVAATRVSAVLACEGVSQHHVVSPALIGVGQAFSQTLNPQSVDVAGGIRAARRPLSCRSADLGPRLQGVRLAGSIAGPRLRSRAHLRAAFLGHRFSLHGRDERCFSLQPCFAHDLAAREGFSHG